MVGIDRAQKVRREGVKGVKRRWRVQERPQTAKDVAGVDEMVDAVVKGKVGVDEQQKEKLLKLLKTE